MENEVRLENEFLLGTMIWSFSRLNSYYNCPYEWQQHYLLCNKGAESSFGQFGSFCHKCLELFANGDLDVFSISQFYEDNYADEVTLPFPPNKHVDIGQSYYEKGLDYFNNIDLNIEDYEVLGVEKEVRFKVEDYDMIGYIDLLLKNKKTGEITILDHKSASIKILKNGNISKTDMAHFEEFKHQLYLYSKAVIEEYGRVDYLEWNLFKDQNNYRIPWKEEEYSKSISWAIDTIHKIEKETEWAPNPDFYYCRYLCGQRTNGCPYKP